MNRVLSVKDKMSVESLVNALLVSESALTDLPDRDEKTLAIHLKPSKLEPNLIAYIRAQSLLMFKGDNITDIKMVDPVDINYEIIVLTVYKAILERIYHSNPERFALLNEDEPLLKEMPPWRVEFVRVYRASQRRILAGHIQIVNSCLSVLKRITEENIKPQLAIA